MDLRSMRCPPGLFLVALFLCGTLPAQAEAPGRSPYSTIPAPGTGIVLTVDPAWLEEGDPPRRSDPKVLVLVYHNIVYGRTGASTNRDIHNFESDLAFYRRQFRIVSFKDLERAKAEAHPGDRDLAILTFDDGDLSMYAIVYPLFMKFGLKATFFIIPELVGEVGYLSWSQIREMEAYRDPRRGQLFFFGSHTQSHEALGEVSLKEIHRQLLESKNILDQRLATPVDALALPYGSGAERREIFEIARSLGYRVVRTLSPEAKPIQGVDLLTIGSFSVDSSSSDIIVRKLMTMVGR